MYILRGQQTNNCGASLRCVQQEGAPGEESKANSNVQHEGSLHTKT